MKKFIKCVVFCAGLIAIPVAINQWIFKNAGRKVKSGYEESAYKWRYGKIRYIVSGHGEPLLLVHNLGVGASLMEWRHNIDMLSKHYKVYALDLIGFGQSAKPDMSYSAYLYVTLINDFVKEIIGKPVGIVANANAAAYAVMAYDFEPTRYNNMLLISPTGVGTSNRMPSASTMWTRWLLESPALGTTIYNMIASKFYIHLFLKAHGYADEALVQENRRHFYLAAHAGGVTAKLPVAALLSHFLNVNIEHALPNVNIPVHVVWGDANDINPLNNFHALKQCCPQAELTIFEGSKLLPHADDPQQFYKLCHGFFV